ncbi:MAG: DUF3108 domain-containing protein [Rubrivivax sp.]
MTALSVAPASPRWRLPLLLLPAVLLAHLWLADRLVPQDFGLGDAPGRIARIDVAFVRELQPAAPVLRRLPVPRHAPRAAAPLAVSAALAAASAPLPAALRQPLLESLPELLPERSPERLPAPHAEPAPAVAAAASVPADAASAGDVAADVTAAAAQAASAPAAFEWPPSTRLDYLLTGNYRGPVEGQARVDWLMRGARYQVHLELSVGPPFAPLVSRRLSSEGEVGAAGLVPLHYEEETRVAFQNPRGLRMAFEPDRIRLANGREVPRPPGVQDSASQFVQMTWLFTTRAGLLAAGERVEIPLALPRSVDLWVYDVLGAETLYTPMGEVATMHVKPRREARPGGDLTAEFWVAPTLQYLPVRILIRQDADTWVDLMIERLPRQAQR